MALTFKLHAIIICRSWVDDIPTSKLFTSFAHLDSIRNAEVYFRDWEEKIKMQKAQPELNPKVKEYYLLFVDFMLSDDSGAFDLLKRFKLDPYMKWVNVIFVNERWNDTDEQRCRDQGVYICLDDPLVPLKVEQVRNSLLQVEELKEMRKQSMVQMQQPPLLHQQQKFKFHGLIISSTINVTRAPPIRHLFATFNTAGSIASAHRVLNEWESKGEKDFQGAQLEAQSQEKEIFILFIDYYLESPGLSGFELLKLYKKTPHLIHIHVVIMSCGNDLDVYDSSIAEGALMCIAHPLTVSQVELIIQHVRQLEDVK